MPPRQYSAVAATVFAIVAILQFIRALSAIPIVIGSAEIPVGASWIASLGAVLLAVLGYVAALRE